MELRDSHKHCAAGIKLREYQKSFHRGQVNTAHFNPGIQILLQGLSDIVTIGYCDLLDIVTVLAIPNSKCHV